MRRLATLTLCALPPALLGACATADDGEYPSLAIRDVERVSGTLPPPAPYVPPPTPATVVDRLTQLASEAANANRVFESEAARARSAVNAARGDGVGSDDWAVAQVALAGLESARSRAMIALADLDRLFVDAATQGGELTRISATRDQVIAQVEQQNAVINGLLGALN
jgi:hypothetical protein